ncbi:hypothetical protein [Patulibacter sp. SYSU D01012]|uniref:DNA-3-methyladenine glycosylase family protein n=1 Tax=Patulibacter sp. SYSU D01012 TaxID=2817381 RepID=UPI001B311F22|nr:hypothetical protein [Patulibacter sp. SYSU D01012]
MDASPLEVRAEVVPPGPFRLPGGSPDGLRRRRGQVLFRYLRVDGHDLLLRAAQRRDGAVVLGSRTAVGERGVAAARAAAETGLARWRFAVGCDADLRAFVRAHAKDPLIGASVRTRPWLMPARRPSVFEALLCAVVEQLIAYEDAVTIQRRIIVRHGAVRRPERPTHPLLRDAPDAAAVAGTLVPAHLEACGLAPKRAAVVHRAARELVAGRIAEDGDGDRLLLRLGRLPEVGTWTLALVAAQALGRTDRPPSGDLNLRKALGRILTGDPQARVPEADVDAWLARYAPWGALAAAHIMATRPDVLPRGRAGTGVPVPA